MTEPRPLARDLAATVTLAAYSAVVAAGFARVFDGWGFMRELGLLVVAGHGASLALRRTRVGGRPVSGWIGAPLVTLLLVWLLLALYYRDTFSGPFPAGATWDALGLDARVVREQFPTAVAPVIYDAGWALLAGVAMVAVVALADAFAFGAQARAEALVPGGVLFVFVAALGSDRLRLTGTAALLAAGVLAVVALRRYHDTTRRVDRAGARVWSFAAPAAVATAVVVGALAAVIGARLPGAHAEPLYDTKGRGGGVTTLVSPLVDIRARLTNRSNVEMFRMRADAPAYWYLTTLPEFDGRQFRMPSRDLDDVEQAAPAQAAPLRQQLQVISLGGKLVPAAAGVRAASGVTPSGDEVALRINRDTGTLLVSDDMGSGDQFVIESTPLDPSVDALRAATVANPPDEVFLALPERLPAVVADTARQVTATEATPYDQMRALQDWFRTEFTYNLDVQAGHSNDAIVQFLAIREGYCEQFAGTFAAMARTLGVPSRVAVGYTPGEPTADGWYSVRGRNAHAWPEVWFDDIGWVPFEPTPGRGMPGAERWTDVAAQQAAPSAGGEGDDVEPGADATVAPTTPPTLVPSESTLPTGDYDPMFDDLLVPTGPVQAPAAPPGDGFPWIPALVLAGLAAAAAAPRAVRRLMRRRSRPPEVRVQSAWQRAQHAMVRAGLTPPPGTTTHQWADATSRRFPGASRSARALAELVDKVSYAPPDEVDLEAPGGTGWTIAEDCERWSSEVVEVANEALTPAQRVKDYFLTYD